MTTKPNCLIIGAGAGNGAGIAKKFGAHGYHIHVASRRLSAVESRS